MRGDSPARVIGVDAPVDSRVADGCVKSLFIAENTGEEMSAVVPLVSARNIRLG